MKNNHRKFKNPAKLRGSVLILTALLMTIFLGIAAMAIDIGYLSTTRNELQNTADAAALAGAGFLGNAYVSLPQAQQASHQFTRANIEAVVQAVAGKNKASGANVQILLSDIIVARWNESTKSMTTENLVVSSGTYEPPEAVFVKARRDNTQNSPISTFFAGLFGVDSMSVTAEAVASISGPTTIAEGELILPFGLSERFFPGNCVDVVRFQPTPSSCAGWHNFFDGATASEMGQKFYDFIQSDDECEFCDEDTLLNGPEWLAANFNITKTPASDVVTPTVTVGEKINYTGGTLATLFNGEYLDASYNSATGQGTYTGDTGDVYKNGNLITQNKAKNPAPFFALFDYFRYRDGDGNDAIWTATVPVYKDDSNVDCKDTGTNPNTAIETVDFAKIEVKMLNPPPDKTIDVYVYCDFTVVDGRSGGLDGDTRGSIPHLVK